MAYREETIDPELMHQTDVLAKLLHGRNASKEAVETLTRHLFGYEADINTDACKKAAASLLAVLRHNEQQLKLKREIDPQRTPHISHGEIRLLRALIGDPEVPGSGKNLKDILKELHRKPGLKKLTMEDVRDKVESILWKLVPAS